MSRAARCSSLNRRRPRRDPASTSYGTPLGGCCTSARLAGSGGAWRTLQGLADFAIVESYLSTAAKWGITKHDALRDLFKGHAWQPPGLQPAG